MPVTLLPKFLELLAQSGEISKVATVVDIREREFLKGFPAIFSSVKEAGYKGELIYLEASDEALVRRFSETRRRHPLATDESPLEGIVSERDVLKEVKAHADKVFDTTHFNVHQLKEFLRDYFSGPVSREKMVINFVSFGYRYGYGIPADADLVIDVRFLPNPYFIDSLKGLDGTNKSVREFVLGREETKDFLKKFKDFLNHLLPLYWQEGKSYLTVAIGCTGGKHRSVVISESIADEMSTEVGKIRRRHRDIEKP
jgi:UPF0042 nucleotide-binding protein